MMKYTALVVLACPHQVGTRVADDATCQGVEGEEEDRGLGERMHGDDCELER